MTSETKFTPGPWDVNLTRYEIIGINGKHVALLPGRGCLKADVATRDADAHLIASAPDLYEALDEAINYVAVMAATIGDHSHAAFLDKCTAALSRARGES